MFDVELVNRTPFAALSHVQIDGAGQEVLVIVLCATFAAGDQHEDEDDGRLGLAAIQDPVRFVDEPRADPAFSSTAFESDIAPLKPRVDVLVHGHAHAPSGRAVGQIEVALRLSSIHKRLRVTGDRQSKNGRPAPFERLPLVYERAFGGTTAKGECCLENPVGIGFRGAASADPTVGSAWPNIEHAEAAHRFDSPVPAGFGIVARHWAPRLSLAGTYDAHWLDEVWPLPPGDFDPLFNQSAPLDQQIDRVTGGESVEIQHMTPSGRWHFRLPRLDVPIHLVHADHVERVPTRIDTVAIHTDRRTVTLKARVAIPRIRNRPPLLAVVLGHATPGWLLARQRLKVWQARPGFIDAAHAPCFHP
ncbi:DUF2169 family type VI secretion system accessory protein [Roseateles amylovorans]|uniref:DUF2169 domain-containing protein n=1 Tax=Roseateles amylovorans TaxID=2978473 RepID=A0ABY6B2K3_9BURK|nr:DUF2169 domain-containing protein [Roseateles amylovorans]UXH78778.1 DUF2169 domain-containing protein [Roseateles amylovorans]